jgi:sterol desaturase/sphingolipid hydroxylase (fatty acid hydroxylase superfamily)
LGFAPATKETNAMTFDQLMQAFVTAFPSAVLLESGRYLVAATLMSVVTWAFWRAYFARRKIQMREASRADYRREVLTSLRTALVFAIVGVGLYLAAITHVVTIYTDFSIRGPFYFVITLAAMIVAQDAYFYWTHRAMHHPRLFRHFHRTHHKSHTPTPWAAYAFDVPEALVHVAFVPLWIALVPMHDLTVYLFVTYQILRNVIGHAGVEVSPVSGKPSRFFGWLTTTTHHDLHHQNAHTNFALYFSWWDRWMGTEHAEYQQRVAEIANRPCAWHAAKTTEAL